MGTFRQNITLISADGQRREELDAQGEGGSFGASLKARVDTGATFSSAPADVLERLGVRRERSVRLRMANGQREQRALLGVREGGTF
jgi:hypothetical protein